jgi:CheY-like chemotaxis protein
MDGLTLAAEIRRYRDTTSLPLVMLTSLGRREAGASTVDFSAYLIKPIKQSQLYDTLAKIFTEKFPEHAQPLAPIPAAISPMAQRVPLHILVAEDHPVNQKLALQLLRKMGYRADVAANGLEVLQAVERQPYDIVLMDVQMPEMDGLEATRRICQRWPREKRPRIVAMTANAMQRDREECLAAGMDDYLSKPVQLKDLQAALERSERPAITPESTARIGDLAPVNWTILEEMRALQEQGQSDFVQEMVDLYLSETPPLLATIREAIAQGDAEGLKFAAHTLKGNSMSLGVQQVAALSLSLELSGRSQTLAGTAAVLAELEREFERARLSLVRNSSPSTRGNS